MGAQNPYNYWGDKTGDKKDWGSKTDDKKDWGNKEDYDKKDYSEWKKNDTVDVSTDEEIGKAIARGWLEGSSI